MPIWSNVRNLHSVDADTGIADSDKDNVAKDLGIVVIQNSYISQLRHAHFFFFFFFFLKECLCSIFLLPLSLRNFLKKTFLLIFEKVVSSQKA